MIFITNDEPMTGQERPSRRDHAIDKKAIIERLLRGYGVPIATLEAPEYSAFDPSIKAPYDPEMATKLLAASGYSPEKPVKFTIQTTRGFKPKDYEMIQAIVGMWRNVGIDANIEIYEIAKHFELRTSHKLAPAAFYNWGNAIGDPTTSTGFAMFGPVAALGLEVRRSRRQDRPALGREGREEAHRKAGRPSTSTSPNRAMSFRSCNTSSRSFTSRISRSPRTSPALCSRRLVVEGLD